MTLVEYEDLELKLSDELKEKIQRDLILPEDIKKVIYHAEKAAKRIFDTKKKRFIAHYQNGFVTFWVEYYPKSDCYEVFNAYSHRIKIQEGDC
ncbi:MAG TPA: hypothetical protein GXZ50_09840 [Clostridia bacterium]|jgi:glutamate synthase (NADPH/NADH) small chain|nr:hypothetical protein [Clostridia bacterium]